MKCHALFILQLDILSLGNISHKISNPIFLWKRKKELFAIILYFSLQRVKDLTLSVTPEN